MEQNKKEEFPEDLKRRERLSEPEGLPKGGLGWRIAELPIPSVSKGA